jgi:hypothetical protein
VDDSLTPAVVLPYRIRTGQRKAASVRPWLLRRAPATVVVATCAVVWAGGESTTRDHSVGIA